MRFPLAVVVTWVSVACSSDDGKTRNTTSAIETCKTEFSAANGYDWHDDLSVATSPPDGGSAPPPPSALDRAVADCTASGQPTSSCDAKSIITHDAAICIAKHHGLADGIATIQAGLVFHSGELKIVWNVQNTTSNDGQGEMHGDTMRIDAISGAMIQKGSWGAIP